MSNNWARLTSLKTKLDRALPFSNLHAGEIFPVFL